MRQRIDINGAMATLRDLMATQPLHCDAARDDLDAHSWASRVCAKMDWRASRAEADSPQQIAYECAAHEAARLFYACANLWEA